MAGAALADPPPSPSTAEAAASAPAAWPGPLLSPRTAGAPGTRPARNCQWGTAVDRRRLRWGRRYGSRRSARRYGSGSALQSGRVRGERGKVGARKSAGPSVAGTGRVTEGAGRGTKGEQAKGTAPSAPHSR